MSIARLLWWLLAYASLGIGIVGIVVPGLPTVPFVLLAACGNKGPLVMPDAKPAEQPASETPAAQPAAEPATTESGTPAR